MEDAPAQDKQMLCFGQVAADLVRARGRTSLEALKATVEQEWQQLKDIRRRITPAALDPSVRLPHLASLHAPQHL